MIDTPGEACGHPIGDQVCTQPGGHVDDGVPHLVTADTERFWSAVRDPYRRHPVQIAADLIAATHIVYYGPPPDSQAVDVVHNGAAFRELIQLNDDLTDLDPVERAADCRWRPPSTLHSVWDAALAAVVDWHLSADGSPLPDWVNDPERTLEPPGCTFAEPELVDYVRAHTPAEIARHRVYISAETLRSV